MSSITRGLHAREPLVHIAALIWQALRQIAMLVTTTVKDLHESHPKYHLVLGDSRFDLGIMKSRFE